jgi:hypothetical protein
MALLAPALLLAAAPAARADEAGTSTRSKFESMEALKGKDYGKPRMT